MRRVVLIILFSAVFLSGWFFNTAYAGFLNGSEDINYANNVELAKHPSKLLNRVQNTKTESPQSIECEQPKSSYTNLRGPKNHVSEEQIKVYQKGIILNIENATWAKFTDTRSMEPVLNQDSNGIEISPNTPNEISVGDIVSYHSNYASGLIIHRVIAQGYDEQGWYVLLKGDNLGNNDPEKVRFEQIHGVLVAVIY